MTAFQVLFPDGSVLHGSVPWPTCPARAEVEDFVMSYLKSPMRHLIVLYGDQLRDMFVSELAAFRLACDPDDPDLRINHTATAIYREALLDDCPGIDEDTLPTISGAAVMFECPVMA